MCVYRYNLREQRLKGDWVVRENGLAFVMGGGREGGGREGKSGGTMR